MRRQPVQRGAVLRQMLRLHAHLPVPVQAEPGQILQDRRGVFRAAAGRVDILQPQQEPPAASRARRQANSAEARGRDADSRSGWGRSG